ncbi:MAG: hypothetical protein COA57_04405 [Flavobacteriales bacterium]|nr:MAG: hypothetical protein COA57_04405 [Flavobacteriales bacterium]
MKNHILVSLLTFLTVLNAFSQKELNTIEAAHDGEIISIVIKSDGSTFLSCGTDKRAYLWDVKNGKKIKVFSGHRDAEAVTAVAYNASGQLFATAATDKKIIVWDATTFRPKKILGGHEDAVTCAAFNPFYDRIASGSKDNTIKIYDALKGTVITTFEDHTDEVTALAYSPDGLQLATASADNSVKIWNVGGKEMEKSIEVPSASAVAYSANGRYLAAAGKKIVAIWDTKNWKQIGTLEGHAKNINSVSFSPDVQYIATASEDKKIIIWKVKTQEQISVLETHDDAVAVVAFSDKGDKLVSGAKDGHIKIWNVKSLEIKNKKFPQGNVDPKLVCTAIKLKEANGNGIIEDGDKPSLNFSITNEGESNAYNLVAYNTLTPVNGLSIADEYVIGNLVPDQTKEVSIPVSTTADLETAFGNFVVNVLEANGNTPQPLTFTFQAKGASTLTYLKLFDPEFISPSGKAELGVPITMKIKILNTTAGVASNVKINYKFPVRVMASDKLSETIDMIQPGETKQISVEFYADKSYAESEIKIELELEGDAASNANELGLVLKVNEELPMQATDFQEVAVSTTTSTDQPLYRGSGDPLKGLNVAKAKDMQIGDYYALIIGIDKYSGNWNPLVNAVNDARAVESLLKEKYKFEHFRVLHDAQATREKIIEEMEWLVENVKEKDNLFIYYSGHGEYKQALNKGYWVPVDAKTASTSKYISNSDIQTFLGGIRSKHTLLVSDACFSGDIFRGNTISVPFDASDKYYKEVHNLLSRQAITSGGLEPVMDGGKDGHSVFAYYFLKALRSNESKYLDAGQLFSKIKIPV